MSDELSNELREYYEKSIQAHRTSGGFEKAADLAKSLGVSFPNGFEQIALTPETAMDWAKRTIGIEKRFKIASGGDFDSASAEKLKGINLDPADVEIAKLSFLQFYSRFMMEAVIARKPDATPEKVSLFRGGGKPIEVWITEHLYKQPEGKDELDKAMKHLENVHAAALVIQPIEGLSRSGLLVAFADKVEKAKSA